jgi:hypothetical protein
MARPFSRTINSQKNVNSLLEHHGMTKLKEMLIPNRELIFHSVTKKAIEDYIKRMDQKIGFLVSKEELTEEEGDQLAYLENDVFSLRLLLAHGKIIL